MHKLAARVQPQVWSAVYKHYWEALSAPRRYQTPLKL